MNVILIGAFPEDPAFMQGGVQASVYGLAKTLQSNPDNKIEVIALPLKASTTITRIEGVKEGIQVTYLTSAKFLASGCMHLPFIFKKIRSYNNAIVHIHGTGLLQLVLLLCLRLAKTNATWTLHGITEKETWHLYCKDKKPGRFMRYIFYTVIERASLRFAAKIIVDTEYVAKTIARKRNVFVIPQGIFEAEFIAADTARDKHLIASVGVLSPRKGHHHLITAFAKTKARLPDSQLIIAGALPVPHYHEILQKLVIELNLQHAVTFMLNPPRSEIIALLQKATLFALHSQEESQGIALCEALAAGLPIVATSVGGIVNVVTHEGNGFLVKYADIDGFSQKMTQLLTDASLCAYMSRNALLAAPRFHWRTIAGDIQKVFIA